VELYGAVDPRRLHGCFRTAVDHHEILRTAICSDVASGHSQQVQEIGDFVWIHEVLSQASELVVAARIQQWCDGQFDQGEPKLEPALRVLLLAVADNLHILLLSLPAFCADAASMEQLVDFVALSYSNKLPGQENILQYGDFAVWQQEIFAGDDTAAGRNFWRDYCRKLQHRRAFPVQYGIQESHASLEILTVGVGLPLVERIEAFASQYKTSWSDALLDCWQLLLQRVTQLPDLPISLQCEGRNISQFENAIGPFAKWVPFQITIDPEQPFSDFLVVLQREVAEIGSWQQSFSGLEGAQADGESGAAPEVGFDYAASWGERRYGDLRFKLLQVDPGSEQFALRLSVRQQHKQLRLQFHFDPSRFDRKTLQEWSESYLSLLTAALENPGCAVGRLPVLNEAQRHRLLVEWNQTARDYPRTHCIHELIEEQAARTPDRIAVRCQDRGLSYRELDEQSNQLAHWLRAHGVGPDQRVGLCMDRSLEIVVGILGILKAGGAYVPLNPEHPPLRLAQQLQGAVALVTEEESLAKTLDFQGAVVCLDRDRGELCALPRTNLPLQTTPENLVYVLFTSGSTGVPTGVAARHRNLVNYTWFARGLMQLEKYPEGLQFAMVSTICADVSLTCIYPALTSGGCLHVIPYDVATDSAQYGAYASREQIDVLKIVPSHLDALLSADGGKAVLPRKYVVVGGEKLTRELVEKIAVEAPECEIVNHYAPTETTCGSLTLRLSGFDWKNWRGPCIPLGRPIANTRLYVLDAYREPVPVGARGELYIAGDGVSAGYSDDPQRTTERFVPDPFVAGATMYRSGDIVRYLADGNIEFLERTDDQVKIRGFRVELGEVQAVLGAHCDVKQAIVLAREGQHGERRLLGWVVLREGTNLSGEELREHVKHRLPEYMVPVRIAVLPKLPLTRNGKVDRQGLPEPEAVATHAVPRTATEQLVATIWQEVLEREQIGVEENFFDVGGHSLLATRIIARLRSRLDVAIPVRMLFDKPTIAGLAGELEKAQREEFGIAPPRIRRVPRDCPLPLSFAQESLWMLDQFEPPNSLYNVPRAWRLKGPLQVAALQRSLDEIVRRHESQRTTFSIRNGRPAQIIANTLHIPLATYDLTALPSDESEQAGRGIIEDESLRPFDLERGPLVRAYLVRLSSEDHVLLIVSHHIISDAWSAAVCFRELTALYEAFSCGAVSPLPQPELQYGDYAVHERQWLQGEVLEKHLAYWRQELTGAPSELELPTDRPRSSARSFRGACETVRLSPRISKAVEQLSRAEATTPFTVLMGAFQTLLWHYSGQPQIVTGTDVANRNVPEVEGMLGFFVNILPIRADFSGNPTFRSLLQRLRQCLFGAYAHQQLPFAKMVQELQPARSNRHNPLVQALFVFQNTPRIEPALAGLHVERFSLPLTSSKFDLAVFMAEAQDGLVGHWVYSTDLFERATILDMSRRFEMLLECVVLNPDKRLDNFNVSSVERRSAQQFEPAQPRSDYDEPIVSAEGQVSTEPEGTAAYHAPRTRMEADIAAIWCEVLQRERIGVEENLFDIGGHSLIATQIAARLRSRLRLEIYVRMLFDHSTIRGLARAIEQNGNDLISGTDLEIKPVTRVAAKE